MAKSKVYDLNYRLNSDEIRAAAHAIISKDIQFVQSPDMHGAVDESQLFDFINNSFARQDETKPIFIPFVMDNHDVLCALIPTNRGIQPYFADSRGILVDNDHRDLALGLMNSIQASYPDLRLLEPVELSRNHQIKNNCGLAVVNNIASILDCYNNRRPIKLTEFPNEDAKTKHFQRIGNELLNVGGVFIRDASLQSQSGSAASTDVIISLTRDDLNKAKSDDEKLWLIAKDILFRSGLDKDAVRNIIGGPLPNPSILQNTTTDTALHGLKRLASQVLAQAKASKVSNISSLTQAQADRVFGQVGATALSSPIVTSAFDNQDSDDQFDSANRGRSRANHLIPKDKTLWEKEVNDALTLYGSGVLKSMSRSVAKTAGKALNRIMPFSSNGSKGIGGFDSDDFMTDLWGIAFLGIGAQLLCPPILPLLGLFAMLRIVVGALQLIKEVADVVLPIIKTGLLVECACREVVLEVAMLFTVRPYQLYHGKDQPEFFGWTKWAKSTLFDNSNPLNKPAVNLSKDVKDGIDSVLKGETPPVVAKATTSVASTSAPSSGVKPTVTPRVSASSSVTHSI